METVVLQNLSYVTSLGLDILDYARRHAWEARIDTADVGAILGGVPGHA